MTFTTHAMPGSHPTFPLIYNPCKTLVISLIFLPASTRIPSPTPARRASCSFRRHALFSMLSSVFTYRTDDRKPGGAKVYIPTQSKIIVTLGSIWFCGLFSFSLISFCINMGENDERRGRGVTRRGTF